jgi:hypothetical protein
MVCTHFLIISMLSYANTTQADLHGLLKNPVDLACHYAENSHDEKNQHGNKRSDPYLLFLVCLFCRHNQKTYSFGERCASTEAILSPR